MCCKWQARVSRLQTSVAWCRVFPLSVFLFSFIFSLPLFFLWVLLGTFCWTGSLWSLCSRKHEPELETNQCNWLGRAWEIRMLVGLPSRCPGSCPAAGQINWLQYDWWHCQTAFRHHLLTNLLKQLNESLPNDSVLYLSICLGLHPWTSVSIFTRIRDPRFPQVWIRLWLWARFSGTRFDFCIIHAASSMVFLLIPLLSIVCTFSFAHAKA